MKNQMYTFILGVLLLTTGLFAQTTDSLYAVVHGDSVTIYHKRVQKNCGARIEMQYRLDDFSLTIGEVDTSKNWYFCNCTFDFSVTLGGLSTGTYTAKVVGFNQYDTVGINYGSIEFTISNGGTGTTSLHSPYQSPCYHPDDVKNEFDISPDDYILYPIYPNPCNPEATITFSIPVETNVTITVYDVNGKTIETLLNNELAAGKHQLIWNGTKYSSGVYFVSMRAGKVLSTQSVMLVK